MRMFAPICAMSGREFSVSGRGSLLKRPVGMIQAPLEALGAKCRTANGLPPISIKGPIGGGNVRVDGSQSSQFLTGLLMALPLCEKDSRVSVSNLKSRPYVRMTLALLDEFNVEISGHRELSEFEIPGGQRYSP